MKKRDLTKALKEIQKRIGIDFVRSDYGHCCQTCAEFRDEKIEKQYDDAKTYIIAKYYLTGMNYTGTFEDREEICLSWNYDTTYNSIVEEELSKYFKVEMPKDENTCIIIQNKEV